MIYVGDKKLKSCFLGGEAVGKVYRGDELLFVKAAPRLPEGYTEAKYIQGDGTAYIDTAQKPTPNFYISMDVEPLEKAFSGDATYFFGRMALLDLGITDHFFLGPNMD